MDIFSIIIPAFNEGSRIEKALDSIKKFNINNISIELILIDNGSTDNTVSIANSYCDKIICLPDKRIGALRNAGVAIASGSYIGFIDSDCLPTVNWANIAKQYLDADSNIGIVGSYYGISNNPTWVEEKWFVYRNEEMKVVNFLPGGNFAMRKSDFVKIGGFREDLITGEDYEFCQRCISFGKSILNLPMMYSVHLGNSKTIKQLYKREFWYGQGYLKGTKIRKMSYCLLFTIITCIGYLMCLYWLVSKLYNADESNISLILGVACVLISPIIYSLKGIYKSKKISDMVPYLVIFTTYYIARANAILYSVTGKTKKLK